jgi:hypothetical protein
MSPERFRDRSVDQDSDPGLVEQLIDESTRTISGLQKEEDPRAALVLAEEQARLQKIAEGLIPPTTNQ